MSGTEDIYEIKRAPDGTFTKTDHFDENCLVEGIVRSGNYLYGVCTLNNDPSSSTFLIAGELSADPQFRTIAPLDPNTAPNGMTVDPEGRIYITETLASRIVRVTLASPLRVERTEAWADGLTFANGIKYQDHAMYVTLLDLTLVSRLVRVPVLPDGSAGEPAQLYQRALTVLDDSLPFAGGFIITDFLNGTLIFWDEQRGAYAETPSQTVYGPTSMRSTIRSRCARCSSGLTICIYASRYIGMSAVNLERHAEQFGALGHPARLSILRLIVQAGGDGISTTELQGQSDIPWTTLNHHLTRLVAAGLVKAERDGKFAIHRADYAALKALTAFLWEDCCKSGKRAKACC